MKWPKHQRAHGERVTHAIRNMCNGVKGGGVVFVSMTKNLLEYCETPDSNASYEFKEGVHAALESIVFKD